MATEVKAYFEEHGLLPRERACFAPTRSVRSRPISTASCASLSPAAKDVDATWDGGEAAKIADAGDRILHTHNVQKYSRVWLNAFLNERFLDVVEQIIGPDIILHHSKLFPKTRRGRLALPDASGLALFPDQSMTA